MPVADGPAVGRREASAIGLYGLEKAWTWVERATKDGSDREARYNMAMAAMEGAMVFQKGLGAVHALSHPTGGLKGYRTHHGTLNAVYLPAVLRFNAPVNAARTCRSNCGSRHSNWHHTHEKAA